MPATYGTLFRSQERTRPWWLEALVWIGTIIAAAVAFVMIYRGCQSLWRAYYSLPPMRRAPTGRLFALFTGLLVSGPCLSHYRNTLFQNPPVRDLATTPAPPLKILRICLRLRLGDAMRILMMALCLYAFFTTAWLDFLPIALWKWITPLSVLSALVSALALDVAANSMFVAVNLFTATLGVGGLAPAALNPQSRAGKMALWFAGSVFSLLAAGLLLLLGAGIANVFFPGLIPVASVFQAYLEMPGNTGSTLYSWFPSVVCFDLLQTSLNGPVHTFRAAAFRGGTLFAVTAVSMFLFLRSGLSPRNRLPWAGEPAGAQPADVNTEVERHVDPDAFNGPLERFWICRFGRMGRAIVRAVHQSYLAGSIDYQIRRMFILFPVFLVAEWLPFTLVMLVIEVLNVFKGRPDLEFSHLFAAACVIMAGLVRMTYWSGQFELANAGTQKTPLTFADLLRGKTQSDSFTRGNPRVKLSDIYPIGFSDAVVLPLTYAAPLILLQGVLGFVEGMVLQIPVASLKWGIAIAVPALFQMHFLALIVLATGDRVHFSRSRIRQFFGTLLLGIGCGVTFIGFIVLFAFISIKLSGRGSPWLAWVACVHILLVFNTAVYMLGRWFYARRRFDAEIRTSIWTQS